MKFAQKVNAVPFGEYHGLLVKLVVFFIFLAGQLNTTDKPMSSMPVGTYVIVFEHFLSLFNVVCCGNGGDNGFSVCKITAVLTWDENHSPDDVLFAAETLTSR